jgi:hypothetical protein
VRTVWKNNSAEVRINALSLKGGAVMIICGMNEKELRAYLESETGDNGESRRALMAMIIAIVDEEKNKYQLPTILWIQDDRDWEIAMDILDQYRVDGSLFVPLSDIADWCKEKGRCLDLV